MLLKEEQQNLISTEELDPELNKLSSNQEKKYLKIENNSNETDESNDDKDEYDSVRTFYLFIFLLYFCLFILLYFFLG